METFHIFMINTRTNHERYSNTITMKIIETAKRADGFLLQLDFQFCETTLFYKLF